MTTKGTFLGSSALIIDGVHDPTTLEAIACREAIPLAQDLQVRNFVISSHSKQVVNNNILRGSQGACMEPSSTKSWLDQLLFPVILFLKVEPLTVRFIV